MARPFHRIVVGFDGSEGSEDAMEVALDLVGETGRALVVTVLAPTNHVETEGERHRAIDPQVARTRGMYEEVLRAHVPREKEVARWTSVESRDVAEALEDYGREHGADLIVVGRFGEGGALHPRVGHVGLALAKSCGLPVLLWTSRS